MWAIQFYHNHGKTYAWGSAPHSPKLTPHAPIYPWEPHAPALSYSPAHTFQPCPHNPHPLVCCISHVIRCGMVWGCAPWPPPSTALRLQFCIRNPCAAALDHEDAIRWRRRWRNGSNGGQDIPKINLPGESTLWSMTFRPKKSTKKYSFCTFLVAKILGFDF